MISFDLPFTSRRLRTQTLNNIENDCIRDYRELGTQVLNDIENDWFRDRAFRDHGAQLLNDIENDWFRDSRDLSAQVPNIIENR
jgi:hypothetical protein